jgi:hypothetical protein
MISLQLSRALLFLTLVALPAVGGPIFFDRTVKWEEEVLLHSGETIVIKRTSLEGANLGASQVGPTKEQSVSYRLGRRSVKFETGPFAWNRIMAFDLYDGVPVVALAVVGREECSRWEYPRHGLVIFEYRNGRWDRKDAIPEGLRVNLGLTFPFMEREKNVTLEMKRASTYRHLMLGVPIDEAAIKWGSHFRQGYCENMK